MLSIRHFALGIPAAILLVLGPGCGKPPTDLYATASPDFSTPLPPDGIARVHWIGKKRLGIEAGAYYIMRIWEVRESKELEARMLAQLSSAPWRLAHGEDQATNAYSLVLRPLLYDLVHDECYLEMRESTNRSAELALAVRLSESRAGTFETNLAACLESLTGGYATRSPSDIRGWSLMKPQSPDIFQLGRVGDWTVFGYARGNNALFGDILGHVRRTSNPFVASTARPGTNYWLQADLDLARISRLLGLDLSGRQAGALTAQGGKGVPGLPRVSFRLSGDGANVLTDGEASFPEPLRLDLEPWHIPLHLIHQPVASLTAVRGFGPGLASSETWNDLQIRAPPNQLFIWSQDGLPVQSFLAVPSPDANQQVRSFLDYLIRKANPWIASHATGGVEELPGSAGAVWKGLQLISPYALAGDGFVQGGMVWNAFGETNSPPPGLPQEVFGQTNLVLYDWELTGARIESTLFGGQAVRVALRRPQLALESPGVAWLNVVRHRLGSSRTVVTSSGPNRLAFSRRSTAGLTAPELQFLVDWLESPRFPRGLHSLEASDLASKAP